MDDHDNCTCIKHCGLALPGDSLACPSCGEWLAPLFSD